MDQLLDQRGPADHVVVPIGRSDDGPRGVLVASLSPEVPYDDGFRQFVDIVSNTVGTALDGAAQLRAQGHLAVADAQDRDVEVVDRRVDRGRALDVHRRGPAGEHDAGRLARRDLLRPDTPEEDLLLLPREKDALVDGRKETLRPRRGASSRRGRPLAVREVDDGVDALLAGRFARRFSSP